MKIGFALCGSFCTLDPVFSMMEALADLHDVTPIFSTAVYETDTRFGKAADHIRQAETICGKKVIHTITQAEPIGPKKLLDVLVIAPCTGNTLAKLACGITDTPVTMAAKAHLRTGRPLLIALATNDAMSGNLKNIAVMMEKKNVFFLPMVQDDPVSKPFSLVADFSRMEEGLAAAMKGENLRPVFLEK